MRNQKIFKNKKLGIVELLREIPEEELTRIAVNTRVDYCSKVLYGKMMFYLLLYGMLCIDRLSQRGLRDAFSSPLFNVLFNQQGHRGISHSSISDRLSIINLQFFEEVYTVFYKRFSSLYTKKEIAGMNLQRVDSTLVKECGNKLKETLYREKALSSNEISTFSVFSTVFKGLSETTNRNSCEKVAVAKISPDTMNNKNFLIDSQLIK